MTTLIQCKLKYLLYAVTDQCNLAVTVSIGVASYGALGHVPGAPLDFQLVILGITRFTDSDESCARFSVQ